MALATAWAQVQTGLTVDYTFKGELAGQGTRVDGVCYVSPSLLRRLGWTVDIDNGLMTVVAEGRTFQLEPKVVEGIRYYPLDQALRYLGAVSEWDEAKHTLKVTGQVRNVEQTATGVRIDSTLTVRPRAFRMSGPDKLVIDVAGATLEPKLLTALPKGWRIYQYNPKTVRFVIESPLMAKQTIPDLAESRTTEMALVSVGAVGQPVQALASVGTPQKGIETKDSVTVVVPIKGALVQRPSAVFLDPTTVQIAVPGSAAEQTGELPVDKGQNVTGLAVDDDKAGTSTVTVKLEKAMAFQLSTNQAGVSITFSRPRSAGGLAGKVIVVDAGHGGKDDGATHYGVREKIMTLAMAKTVATALSQAGASVIMTRSDDTFIPLGERPGLANRSHADMFISCHFNSNSVDDSRSGTIIFYHKDDSMDMLLAECIRNEVAKFSELPDLGSWSDGRIYSSGFAVLRGAQMPAVLMELGFLNHSHDRARIQEQAYRDAIAKAVVRGVKEFLGDGKKD